jgi:hypothetical protein
MRADTENLSSRFSAMMTHACLQRRNFEENYWLPRGGISRALPLIISIKKLEVRPRRRKRTAWAEVRAISTAGDGPSLGG